MASLMIHLLIGQEYCKYHKVQNELQFLHGSLAPDLVKDKRPSHFSRNVSNKTFTESVINKVGLPDFCHSTDILTDFNKGSLLHLITDYIYFHEYLINDPRYKEIEHLNQLTIRDIIYRDYHRINKLLMDNNPDLKLHLLPDFAKVTRTDEMELLSLDAVENIIKYCSTIDIEHAYEHLKKFPNNNPDM